LGVRSAIARSAVGEAPVIDDAIFDAAAADNFDHPGNFNATDGNFDAAAYLRENYDAGRYVASNYNAEMFAAADVHSNIDAAADHSSNNNAAAIYDASDLPGNDEADINVSTDNNVSAKCNAAAVLFSFLNWS
jgi:hypothetical protein